MVLTHRDVLNVLPQRPPILLVDSSPECIPGKRASAELFVNPAWPVFSGHFPGTPILPGICIQESLAQTADLFLLTMPENSHKIPYFFSVNRMRFLRSVQPGDHLTLYAELAGTPQRGLYDCNVRAAGRNLKIASGSITLALR